MTSWAVLPAFILVLLSWQGPIAFAGEWTSDAGPPPRLYGIVPVPDPLLPPGTPDLVERVTWSPGGPTTYRGVLLEFPAHSLVATDGATYLYATTDHSILRAEVAAACLRYNSPGQMFDETGTPRKAVLVDAYACHWTPHPSRACTGDAALCALAIGDGIRVPPEDSPLAEVLMNPPAETLFFGVAKSQAPTVEAWGIRGGVRPSDLSDTFAYPTANPATCHHRWPGMKWAGIPPWGGVYEGLIQTGLSRCSNSPPGTFLKWCWYIDTQGTHRRSSPVTHSGTTQMQVFEISSYQQTTEYRCYWNGSYVWQVTIDQTRSAYGPKLYATGENNFGANPPVAEHFPPNQQQYGALYRNAAGSWVTPPQDYFYANNGETGDPCLTFGWGVRKNAVNDISVGSGLGCPTGSAW